MSRSSAAQRRTARETALRVLYMLEVGRPSVEEALAETISANELDAEGTKFVTDLVTGSQDHRRSIDVAILRHAIGYPPERQTVVDRNILRIALTELLFPLDDTPAGVIANEAVELAKKYSTPEAAKFINGILGTAIREKEESEREATASA